MLSISNISKSFGGIKALNNVSLNFEKGHITALIGPNGAGKTTLFNVINGSLKPDVGKVCLNTENITGLEPHQLFSKGVLRTFQISQEFQSLTVLFFSFFQPELVYLFLHHKQFEQPLKHRVCQPQHIQSFLDLALPWQ